MDSTRCEPSAQVSENVTVAGRSVADRSANSTPGARTGKHRGWQCSGWRWPRLAETYGADTGGSARCCWCRCRLRHCAGRLCAVVSADFQGCHTNRLTTVMSANAPRRPATNGARRALVGWPDRERKGYWASQLDRPLNSRFRGSRLLRWRSGGLPWGRSWVRRLFRSEQGPVWLVPRLPCPTVADLFTERLSESSSAADIAVLESLAKDAANTGSTTTVRAGSEIGGGSALRWRLMMTAGLVCGNTVLPVSRSYA